MAVYIQNPHSLGQNTDLAVKKFQVGITLHRKTVIGHQGDTSLYNSTGFIKFYRNSCVFERNSSQETVNDTRYGSDVCNSRTAKGHLHKRQNNRNVKIK